MLLAPALLCSALLCYALAPLLISRPAPSASSPPATLVYIWRRGSRAYARISTASSDDLTCHREDRLPEPGVQGKIVSVRV